MLSRLALFCLLASAGPAAAAAPVADRHLRETWRRGDLAEMERLASTGDVRSQHWMGLMLQNLGRHDEAIRWYARAADQGDGRSANRIAFFHEHGTGRPKDMKAALDWHRRAAVLGDFSSRIRYASALRSGDVLARNEGEAFGWYARVARQRGYAQAGYAYLPLAEMYEEGIAVPRDLKRAYAFAKAAEHTVDDSDSGSEAKARLLREDLAGQLRPSDLAAAERMFEKLRPDPAKRSANLSGYVFLLVAAAMTGIGALLWRRSRRPRREPVR